MRIAAVFEHKDQLVLASVERTHPGVVLDPDAEVLELAIDIAAGGQQLFGMAPVHENVVQRALDAGCREIAESLGEKGGEFGAVHLSRGHRERPVMDRAEATRVTVDPHVVGRVGDGRRGTFQAHQCGKGRAIESAATQQPMATEHP